MLREKESQLPAPFSSLSGRSTLIGSRGARGGGKGKLFETGGGEKRKRGSKSYSRKKMFYPPPRAGGRVRKEKFGHRNSKKGRRNFAGKKGEGVHRVRKASRGDSNQQQPRKKRCASMEEKKNRSAPSRLPAREKEKKVLQHGPFMWKRKIRKGGSIHGE